MSYNDLQKQRERFQISTLLSLRCLDNFIYFSMCLLYCLSIVYELMCLMWVQVLACTYTPPIHPSPLQSSSLHYQIYCKTALWESTHALPSLRTAPWQLLLYIPLQMRAMNRSDYRVEQRQRRRGGKERVRRVKRERRGESEGERKKERKKERRTATGSTSGSDWGLL